MKQFVKAIKKYIEKYKDIVPYAVFGIFTTIINICFYWICAHPLSFPVMASTVIAWIISVMFAYVTNRKWVFHSETIGGVAVIKEMISFFIARLATGIIDWLCMFIFVDIMSLNDVAVKTLANIIVIIINYVASKMLIFKHKE